MQNAKAANMPKDTVERAIKKATDKDAGDYKEITYEGYGPHGIAIFVEAATDNNTVPLQMSVLISQNTEAASELKARSLSFSTTKASSKSNPKMAYRSKTSNLNSSTTVWTNLKTSLTRNQAKSR